MPIASKPRSQAAQKRSQPKRHSAAAIAADLRIGVMRLARMIRSQKSEGLKDGQFSILCTLERLGPLAPGELAEHERVQPPSMTRMITCLVDMGLVDRSEHPSDRRQVVITVNDAGRSAIRETKRRRDEWLCQQLSALTPEERDIIAQASEIIGGMTSQ